MAIEIKLRDDCSNKKHLSILLFYFVNAFYLHIKIVDKLEIWR